MQRILSFEQTPPLSVPLRFFLTAPAFAIAAGGLVLWHGPQAFASRWTPLALALTHLLTLGFLALSMAGALLQILPVVAGIDIPRARTSASGIHLLLALGALLLPAAFLWSEPALFKAALLSLLPAFGWLLCACGSRLLQGRAANPPAATVRLALLALAITIGLGSAAASTFAWPSAPVLPLRLPLTPSIAQLANLHAAWGLAGWVGLLVAGVAWQVVPMFQVTPGYPGMLARHLGWIMLALLALWTIAQLALGLPGQTETSSVLAGCGYAAFAIVTLYLLWRRKRPRPEITTLFWYVGTSSLLCCAALWVSGALTPRLAAAPAYPFVLGILFIIGFAGSTINGMLYKIVPFLVWYHLQNRLPVHARAPNVRHILSERATGWQFAAHVTALALLIAAAVWPEMLARAAAVAFMASSCWLWINLIRASLLYRAHLRKHAAPFAAAAAAAATPSTECRHLS